MMLAKSSAAFTHALFPPHRDGFKVVVNDFLVKKYSEFMDILYGEAVVDDSRVLVPVCNFPGSLKNLWLTINQCRRTSLSSESGLTPKMMT
jgi:hypothetical protein